jgi:hypothetical protein
VTCDEVRELLPEHLLGSLAGPEHLEIRRHLRACAACRAEMAALADGVASFARAAHDRTPPDELRDRIMTALEQEWHDMDEQASVRSRASWIGRAAAIVVVVAALTLAAAQTQRANVATADAESYTRLLATLGGKEFRIGELDATTTGALEGSVVLYDSHRDQSWGIVLVRAPGQTGKASVTLASDDGRTIEAGTLEFQTDGDAATWLVTSSDLTPFDRLTITAEDGTVLATADIALA